MIFNSIKRMFYKPNWKLAIKEFSEEEDSSILNREREIKYNLLKTNGDYWCADPFIWDINDQLYIFCECYLKEKNKGVIAVGEYKKGEFHGMKIIIEQDYHMSYPCVFKYNSIFYMIPETSDNKTIELYQAKNFPYDWELIKILKNDIRCVDTTVFVDDNNLYAIGYILHGKRNIIGVFQFDMANITLKTIDQVECDNTGRSAGNIININGKLVRPTQISKKKYGESIAFKEIVSINNDVYYERQLSKLQGKNISVKGEKKIDRIHTVNRVGKIEIIDYSHDSFDLVRPARLILSKLKGKACW